jgi:hypothetical protein
LQHDFRRPFGIETEIEKAGGLFVQRSRFFRADFELIGTGSQRRIFASQPDLGPYDKPIGCALLRLAKRLSSGLQGRRLRLGKAPLLIIAVKLCCAIRFRGLI